MKVVYVSEAVSRGTRIFPPCSPNRLRCRLGEEPVCCHVVLELLESLRLSDKKAVPLVARLVLVVGGAAAPQVSKRVVFLCPPSHRAE